MPSRKKKEKSPHKIHGIKRSHEPYDIVILSDIYIYVQKIGDMIQKSCCQWGCKRKDAADNAPDRTII